jgi:hypothetical protein
MAESWWENAAFGWGLELEETGKHVTINTYSVPITISSK